MQSMDVAGVVPLREKAGYFASVQGEILSRWYPNGIGPWKIREDLPLRVLSPRPNSKGYLRVSLGKDNDFYIHRLIWAAFHEQDVPKKLQIRHLDGDKSHNWPGNLAVGNQIENEDDKRRHGRTPLGEIHVNSKLTADLVREARKLDLAGLSLRQIVENLNLSVTRSTLHEALRYKTWRHL